MMIRFTLPIVPTAQARPKVAVRGKAGNTRFFAHAYKTEGQKANERSLEAWLKDYAPAAPLSGPLALDFIAGLPVPASASKKHREAMLAGFEFPAKKPDLDNIAKQLKDAMTRMRFWGDDAQIVTLRCKKIYAEQGFWKVSVYPAVRQPLGEERALRMATAEMRPEGLVPVGRACEPLRASTATMNMPLAVAVSGRRPLTDSDSSAMGRGN